MAETSKGPDLHVRDDDDDDDDIAPIIFYNFFKQN